MSFIIFPQADNKLAVIIPTGDVQDAVKDVPAGVSYKIVDSLPHDFDNDFFDAYEYDVIAGVKPNISRAQEIQVNKWISAQAPLLHQVDQYYDMAVDEKDENAKEIIVGWRKALRNVANYPIPSDSIASIKATIPPALTQNYTYPTP
jgi:hypothetical protein